MLWENPISNAEQFAEIRHRYSAIPASQPEESASAAKVEIPTAPQKQINCKLF